MTLRMEPCLDSLDRAEQCRRALDVDRQWAARLGHEAVDITAVGRYRTPDGTEVDISAAVARALELRASLPPDARLPDPLATSYSATRVCVANETTLAASRRLIVEGYRTAALNMANGVSPGGGFLHGARAQEETLCRSSALHATLAGDAMYEAHRARHDRESSDWVIVSPDVPVFRADDGSLLPRPWACSFLSSAAPYAPRVGQPRSGDLLYARFERALAVAQAFGFEALVLGAWGCGAFGNDAERTAADVRRLLEGPFDGAFAVAVFAIADWSEERRFLGPFRDRLSTG